MSTPALARAAEEVAEQDAGGPLMRTHVPRLIRAHAIVSAALCASDQLRDPDAGRDPVAEALCSHDDSAHHMERTDDFPCSACVSAADAVRAAILGEAR